MPEHYWDILIYLREYQAEYGWMPTHREIQAGCGISSLSLVNRRMDRLADEGYVIWARGKARCIRLTARGLGFVNVSGSHQPLGRSQLGAGDGRRG